MAMVITGIVAGIVSVFLTQPIIAYVDSVRRAEMSDVADLALRRIGFELRGAVPNSLNVISSNELAFVPTKDGGRYRSAGAGQVLDFAAAGDASFDVLGGPVKAVAGDYVVIGNTGQPGNDVYAGDNRRELSAPATTTVSYLGAGAWPVAARTDKQLFLIVPKEGPVRFRCLGGSLTRTSNYQAGFSTGSGAISTTLADQVNCSFDYQAVNFANGLLTIRLTVTREGESVTMINQLHLDNAP